MDLLDIGNPKPEENPVETVMQPPIMTDNKPQPIPKFKEMFEKLLESLNVSDQKT